MENLVLNIEKREVRGKGGARKLRKEGYVPGILYSPHREDPEIPIKIFKKEIHKVFSGDSEHHVVNLNLGNEEIMAILKEVQRDPIKNSILHVDFFKVFKGEKVTVEVPIELIGESKGVKKGGILEHLLREIEIETVPSKIPDIIEVDISDLDLGDSLLVSDIKFPEDVEPLTPLETAVVSILAPTKVEEEVEEEAEEAEEIKPEEETE
jgi:large subunit ribosomal protein L25